MVKAVKEKLPALAAIRRQPDADPRRQMLEACAEPDRNLGNKLFVGERCRTHRITAQDDIRTNTGFGRARNIIVGVLATLLLWISTPCTGGCLGRPLMRPSPKNVVRE